MMQVSGCTACNLCRGCCQCYACSQCGAPHTHKSTLCNRCGGGTTAGGCGCCVHERRESPNFSLFKNSVDLALYHATDSKDLKQNPSSRLISAEMEICGLGGQGKALTKALKSWKCSAVSDGSLPSGGFEINTHPASGDFFIDMINDICQGLKTGKAWVNERAGCHTHIDARDLGYLGISRLLRIMGCIEPAMFMMLSHQRRGSNFCTPSAGAYLQALHKADDKIASTQMTIRQQTLEYRSAITNTLYGKSGGDTVTYARQSKGHSARYRAVNLHSWFYRGTIEFRMPPGTIYESNVINWGLLLANIVDVAAARSHDEIIEFTHEVERLIREGNLYKTHPNMFTVMDKSIALLKALAPSAVVREWIVERIASMKRDSGQFRESY